MLTRDTTLLAGLESTWGVDPVLSGADAFDHKVLTGVGFERNIARYNRTDDRSPAVADILSTQRGRESTAVEVAADLVPSGNSITPTAPDIDPFFHALFGARSTLTAHTTTDAGSAGTSLVLAPGGGAASGIPTGGGCLIACDVSALVGVEVRYVVSRTVDTVTLNRAFTSDPAAGRAVYVGTTYRLDQAATNSLWLSAFSGAGNYLRYAVPGTVIQSGGITINGAQDTPVVGVTFSGMGAAAVAHTLDYPTLVTSGLPLIPQTSKIWISGDGSARVVNATLNITNTLELRMNAINSITAVGVKRTANGGRYAHTMGLDIIYEPSGGAVVRDMYLNHPLLQAYDVIVQLGTMPGDMAAWYCPHWVPDVPAGSTDGEMSFNSTGPCYGVVGDDSVFLTIF